MLFLFLSRFKNSHRWKVDSVYIVITYLFYFIQITTRFSSDEFAVSRKNVIIIRNSSSHCSNKIIITRQSYDICWVLLSAQVNYHNESFLWVLSHYPLSIALLLYILSLPSRSYLSVFKFFVFCFFLKSKKNRCHECWMWKFYIRCSSIRIFGQRHIRKGFHMHTVGCMLCGDVLILYILKYVLWYYSVAVLLWRLPHPARPITSYLRQSSFCKYNIIYVEHLYVGTLNDIFNINKMECL